MSAGIKDMRNHQPAKILKFIPLSPEDFISVTSLRGYEVTRGRIYWNLLEPKLIQY